MFLDSCSLLLPTTAQHHFSDEEFERLSSTASHVCPNCDGELSNYEADTFGICGDCYGDSAQTYVASSDFSFATGH